MTDQGLAEVERAKADGRWEKAYAAFKDATPPQDFLDRLKKNKKASAFFKTLNKTNIYRIVYQLHTAKKPETRERRLNQILEALAEGSTAY